MSTIGSIGGGLIGGVLDIATKKWSNKQQVKQQQKLTDQQTKAQKEIGEFNQGLALNMWEKTNYSAQREQMEKAGLNTGLMYGGTGAGGTTSGGQAGGVSGGQASNENSLSNSVIQGMGLAMQQAQIENIKADTKKKETEAGNIGQNTQNQITQNEINKWELELKKDTREAVMGTIEQEFYKKQGEAFSAQIKGNIDSATENSTIEKIRAEAIGATLVNDYTRAGIKVTEAQINKINEELKQGWTKIEQENQKIKLNEKELDIKAQELTQEVLRTNFSTGTTAEIERAAKIANYTSQAITNFLPWKTTTTSKGEKGQDWWESTTTTTKTK